MADPPDPGSGAPGRGTDDGRTDRGSGPGIDDIRTDGGLPPGIEDGRPDGRRPPGIDGGSDRGRWALLLGGLGVPAGVVGVVLATSILPAVLAVPAVAAALAGLPVALYGATAQFGGGRGSSRTGIAGLALGATGTLAVAGGLALAGSGTWPVPGDSPPGLAVAVGSLAYATGITLQVVDGVRLAGRGGRTTGAGAPRPDAVDRTAGAEDGRDAGSEREPNRDEGGSSDAEGRDDGRSPDVGAGEGDGDVPDLELSFEVYSLDGWYWRLVDGDGSVLAAATAPLDSEAAVRDRISELAAAAPGASIAVVGPPAHDGADHDEVPDHARSPSSGGSGTPARPAAPEPGTFELYATGGGWRFQLRDGRDAVLVEAGRRHDSVQAVRAAIAELKTEVAGAGTLEYAPAGFEVFRDPGSAGDDGPDGDGDPDDSSDDVDATPVEGTDDHAREEPGRWRWRLAHRSSGVLAVSGDAHEDRDAAIGAVERLKGLDDPNPELRADGDRWTWAFGADETLAVPPGGFEAEARARLAAERVVDCLASAGVIVLDPLGFELSEGDDGWRFRVRHRDGGVVAGAGGYDDRASAVRDLRRVMEIAPGAEVGVRERETERIIEAAIDDAEHARSLVEDVAADADRTVESIRELLERATGDDGDRPDPGGKPESIPDHGRGDGGEGPDDGTEPDGGEPDCEDESDGGGERAGEDGSDDGDEPDEGVDDADRAGESADPDEGSGADEEAERGEEAETEVGSAGEGDPDPPSNDEGSDDGAGTAEVEFEVRDAGRDVWGVRVYRDGGVLAEGTNHRTRESALDAVERICRAATAVESALVDPAAFVLRPDGEEWTWRLVTADGTVLANSGDRLASESAAREAIAAAREALDGGTELYQDDGWRWRLRHDGDVVAAAPRGYGSTDVAREMVDRARRLEPGATIAAVDGPVGEVHAAGDGWGWRLRAADGTVLLGATGYESEDEAATDLERLADRAETAPVRVDRGAGDPDEEEGLDAGE